MNILCCNCYIVDNSKPNVTSPGTGELLYGVNETVTIFAQVTDDTGIDNVYANVTLPSSGNEIVNLTYDMLLGRYQGSFTTTDTVGTYSVQYVAEDVIGLINNSLIKTLSIQHSPCSSVASVAESLQPTSKEYVPFIIRA